MSRSGLPRTILAGALRPLVSRAYALKRRYRIGDRFLSRHPDFAHALMALLRPVKLYSVVDVHGHELEVEDGDYLGLTINRIYEPEVTHFLERSVRGGQTAIDLGAHVGYFTLLLAKLVGPAGRVIAFEPDPDNFQLLERNVRANGYENVTLHRQAVADRCGQALLYRSPVNPGDHRLVECAGCEAVEVEVVALDELLPELRGTIQWIKIDIQGAELAALRGMRALLASCPEVTIVTEFCPRALAEFGDDPASLPSLLAELGFCPGELRANGELRPVAAEELLSRVSAEDATYVNVAFTRPSG